MKIAKSILCLTTWIWVLPAPAKEPQSTTQPQPFTSQPEIAALLKTITEARSGLRRGIFSGSGEILDTSESPEPFINQIYCAFDNDTNSFRFDTRGFMDVAIAPASQLTPEVMEQIRQRTYQSHPKRNKLLSFVVSNPEYETGWSGIGESLRDPEHAMCHIGLRDPGKPSNEYHSAGFHVETAGLLITRQFGMLVDLPQAWEMALVNRGLTYSIELRVINEDELQVVSRDKGDVLVERRVTVNRTQGYTITGMEVVQLDESGQDMEVPRRETSATWELKNSVWLPVRLSAKQVYVDETESCDYQLNWEAINPTSIDPALFRYESFVDDVWDGIKVYENRNGRRDYVTTIGATPEQVERHRKAYGAPKFDITQPVPPAASRKLVIWLNVLLGLLCLLVGGYQLIAWRMKHRSSGK